MLMNGSAMLPKIPCTIVAALVFAIGCGPSASGQDPGAVDSGITGSGSGGADASGVDSPIGTGSGQTGCEGLNNCFSVYAHSDHVLYVVDLAAKTIATVGPLAPAGATSPGDVMTDLAVAPDNTIYMISEFSLFTASPVDGHVTKVGSLSTCGNRAVALTTTPAGKIYTGDYSGSLCEIDITQSPPVVRPPVKMSGGLALAGDLVAIDDGTVYGTAYKLSDNATKRNNLLVDIDLATGAVTQHGATGFPDLYGASFALGKVFGFTHDGTGDVVTIDRTTGQSTMFASFKDPTTGLPISFAGAGVNSLVTVVQ